MTVETIINARKSLEQYAGAKYIDYSTIGNRIRIILSPILEHIRDKEEYSDIASTMAQLIEDTKRIYSYAKEEANTHLYGMTISRSINLLWELLDAFQKAD